jgi:hypothetical protein
LLTLEITLDCSLAGPGEFGRSDLYVFILTAPNIPRGADRSIEPNTLRLPQHIESRIAFSAVIWKARQKMKKVVDDSAEEILAKSAVCFDLAKDQHGLAEKLHEVAAKQQDNAGKQQEIASQQHLNADKLEAKAAALDVLGHELQYKAIEMSAETELTPVRARNSAARAFSRNADGSSLD